MPFSVYSISIFRESLSRLTKKSSDGYYNCKPDICSFFNNKSFDDIWEMHYRVKDLGNIRIIKIRIQNSNQNTSKSAGYRIIICCNKNHGTVTLLNIYPKRGGYSRVDQEKDEYKDQLRCYAAEFGNGTLVSHNIADQLSEIKE